MGGQLNLGENVFVCVWETIIEANVGAIYR